MDRSSGPAVRLTLVPHTHWDREWYLPFEGFRERLVRMMDGLLALADRGFPHFHLDGQVAMIEDYLAVRPERADDLARHVREGRLSAGPWFTQMDEFLVSGESHVRNLERGLARARELGRALEVGYLPDQFGHIGQMPQLLRAAGIDRAVVWRGVPASIDRTAFRWESPDGSRVLAEYLAFGYGLGGGLRDAETPQELAEGVRGAVDRLRPLSPRDGLLVMAGADHHGPDPTLPERLAATASLLPAVEARVGSLEDHLARPMVRDLPVWRGELRSSARAHLLPGVVSARIHQKRERARVEALVERYAEPLAALVPGGEWPHRELERAWTLLLWNGAHDSVCGCSVDEVAAAVEARLAEARAIAEDVLRSSLERLAASVAPSGTLRFNPSPFERKGVPGLGWDVAPAPIPPPGEPAELDIRGDHLVVDGVPIRLFDEPDVGDLYNFCPAEGGAPRPPDRMTAGTGLVWAGWESLAVGVSAIRRDGIVVLDLTIRNARPDHRLRLSAGLPRRADRAVALSPFEVVERPLVSEGSSLEAPSPTWPARGAVLAGGLAVLAEGVFEYEVVDGKELAVTLLRCVGTISRPSLATRPWPAGPDVPTPRAQMLGETNLALALLPNAGPRDLVPAWERLALPLATATAPGGGALAGTGSLLEVIGAALSSVRHRGDALEARLWNPGHAPAR
ncbi:MAG TPA: hypothetical protein VEO00_02420, partial [Actinomycetota bacterium]|nr:hypothetical protein [Actinomycetota bacterium]